MSCDVRVIVDEAILGLLVDEAVDGDVGLVVILLADKSAGRRASTGNEDLEAVAVAVAVAVGVALVPVDSAAAWVEVEVLGGLMK